MRQEIIVCLLGALLLGGCAKNIVKTGMPGLRHEITERQPYGFWGLVPTHHYATTEFCQAGVLARVEQKMTFGNALAYFFTLGLYSPRTLQVTCARLPQKQTVQVEPGGQYEK